MAVHQALGIGSPFRRITAGPQLALMLINISELRICVCLPIPNKARGEIDIPECMQVSRITEETYFYVIPAPVGGQPGMQRLV